MNKLARHLTVALLWLVPNLAQAQLVASVLPTSRAVPVGKPATAFAAIVNAGTSAVSGCTIAPDTSIPATFVYQTTNPATNAVTGTPNTPVTIPAGGLQTFVIAFTPTAAFAATDVALNFSCANTDPAPQLSGINSLLLAASSTGSADIVALAATTGNNGIVSLPNASGTGAFAVATVNVGVAGTITASADTGGVPLPVNIALCQTNQMTGACLATPTSTVSTSVAASATPTFGIFVTGSNNVAPLPGANRVFVRFKDSQGNSVGATGVAVQTQGYNPLLPPALTFNVADPLPSGTVGQPYGGQNGFSLCLPPPISLNGMINSLTAACVPDPSNPFSPTAPGANPQGGSPPYHCQLDSGGFPPIGISLTKDCILKGTPTAAGTATFRVCAVDLNGSQVCRTTHISVVTAAGAESWAGTFSGTYVPLTPARGCSPAGKFAENGSMTLQFPSPGLIGLMNQGGSSVGTVTGSWTVSESVLQASCMPEPSPTSYTTPLITSFVTSNGVQLFTQNAVFPIGSQEEIDNTAVGLVITSINQAGTSVSGTVQTPFAPPIEQVGTFTLNKQ